MEVTVGADTREPDLAEQGHRHIEWALQEMPVLFGLMEQFREQRALQGVRLGCCLHITTEQRNYLSSWREGT